MSPVLPHPSIASQEAPQHSDPFRDDSTPSSTGKSYCLFPAGQLARYRNLLLGEFAEAFQRPDFEAGSAPKRVVLVLDAAVTANKLGVHHERLAECVCCWHQAVLRRQPMSRKERFYWVLRGRQCWFPSAELREYRRNLTRSLAKLEACVERIEVPFPSMEQLVQVIYLIDDLRIKHEELDGCPCWYTAEELKAHPRESEAKRG